MYYTKDRRRRKGAKKRLAILILFIACSILAVALVKPLLKNNSKQDPAVESASIEPETLKSDIEPSHAPPVEKQNSQLLGDAVQSALTGTHGDYGIFIENLKTKEFYSLNEHMSFSSASLYKLWVMLTVYDQINKGLLKKDTVLSESVSTLNKKFSIASESAERTDGIETLSVADALNQMITISDNYAALLLTERVKLAAIDAVMKKDGFYESHLGINGNQPTTTPYDIGLLFEKLYEGKLSDKKSTGEMMDLLKAQELNEKIPQYLPAGTIVAHKTGELDEFTHDAGIVYAPEFDYIIVVLTKSDDPDSAVIRIANVSQEVYSYFNNN